MAMVSRRKKFQWNNKKVSSILWREKFWHETVSSERSPFSNQKTNLGWQSMKETGMSPRRS